MATLRSMGFAGVDPTIMGVGPVPASRMALEKAGLQVKDIDYWEINEAFAIVALNCIKELGIDPDRVNVMGGGTAIGHALGATGVRLVGTLARILKSQEWTLWSCQRLRRRWAGGGHHHRERKIETKELDKVGRRGVRGPYPLTPLTREDKGRGVEIHEIKLQND